MRLTCCGGDSTPTAMTPGLSKSALRIWATLREDAPISMERYEREAIGRRAVLDIVQEACERAPELESDWFAVSILR